MSNGKIKGLGHIGVFINDIDVSIDFYTRLGFKMDHREDVASRNVRVAFMSAGSCILELVEKPGTSREAGVVDHICMEVDNIEAAVDLAISNGIQIDPAAIETIDVMGGIKNVFFTGPDNERLEFFTKM
ncbi:MAG: VOC family protein [Defluviitaleaceae bacterium]|nr:VOC family protein [Defluviitaleaceae bacterium]